MFSEPYLFFTPVGWRFIALRMARAMLICAVGGLVLHLVLRRSVMHSASSLAVCVLACFALSMIPRRISFDGDSLSMRIYGCWIAKKADTLVKPKLAYQTHPRNSNDLTRVIVLYPVSRDSKRFFPLFDIVLRKSDLASFEQQAEVPPISAGELNSAYNLTLL
ncbi:MAG: hypothetical protein AAGG48_30125 [Planctomycetota bacterium]